MFTRIVSMQLKPNARKEFTDLFEKEVLPTLRKQQGFQEFLLSIDPGGPEVVAISLWESKENAETYSRTMYPELLKMLAKVIEPNPRVKTHEVVSSTLQKKAERAAA
jgi:quinol monooxygenase YgiN